MSGYYPRKVVLTNGEWLIIFGDVVATFLSDTPDAAGVSVLSDFRAWERSFRDIFQTLSYHAVASASPSLQVAELPFRIKSSDVDAMMHGLRLLFAERPTLKSPGLAPQVEVRPLVFIHTRSGAWLRVESEFSSEMPHRYNDLPAHLSEVRQVATALLDQVRNLLGINLDPRSLKAHYSDDSFLALSGITEEQFRRDARSSEYLIVTGKMTHYLLPEPTVPDCPFHIWAANRGPGGGFRTEPIFTQRVRVPRSFFVDGEPHHCAHFAVAAAKSSIVTEENRSRCGSRSGRNGEAFCEIAPFEQCLCCRTCAFVEVCTNTEVFHLPCMTLAS